MGRKAKNTPATKPQRGHRVHRAGSDEHWFEIAMDFKKKWHWCLWSANGRPVAYSATPFARPYEARTAIANILASLHNGVPVIVTTDDPAGAPDAVDLPIPAGIDLPMPAAVAETPPETPEPPEPPESQTPF